MEVDYSRYELSSREKGLFLAAGYIAIFALGLLFYHSLILAVPAGCMIIFFLPAAGEYKAEKRRQLLTVQFRDMLYSLSSSMAAGRQMSEALLEAKEDLEGMYPASSPLCRELSYMATCMKENRADEKGLLLSLAQRSGIEDICRFADVYVACRETGGDLQHVIIDTSSMLTDKMEIERAIRALTAQKQFESVIISVMPVACILLLNIFAPDYLAVMYEKLAGRLLMTLALAGIVTAFIISRKILRIEV